METNIQPDEIIEPPDETTLTTTNIETAVNVSPPSGSLQVPLSQEVVDFLISRQEAPYEVLSRAAVSPPLVDDSLPLSHYFISTSHNTYLLSCQLMGTADAAAYSHVLSHACRCVEIDVWLSTQGSPIVTHGWTWSEHIPFRDVCVAIGNAVHQDDWPVIISLECHISVDHQDMIVNTMREVWGEKLVDKEVEGFEGREREVSPGLLRGKILLLVEYYPPKTAEQGDSDTSEHDSPPREKHRISAPLAALGIYGRSVKPRSGWLQQETTEQRHILYNLSENALGKLMPRSLQELVANSLVHMRRVYPRGTRVTSNNLVPLEHWRSGTNVAALNWQRYDRGLQFNEAMFVGTGGWVAKPDRLRGMKSLKERQSVRLSCEVIGGCNIPKPSHDIKGYVYAELFVSSGDKTWKSQVRHPSSPAHSSYADINWNEHFHWEYLEDDLAFLRQALVFLRAQYHGIDAREVDYLCIKKNGERTTAWALFVLELITFNRDGGL